MKKERYKEEYEEVSKLIWTIDIEDKITHQFYRDLSHLSNKINYSKKKNINIFDQILRLIKGQG